MRTKPGFTDTMWIFLCWNFSSPQMFSDFKTAKQNLQFQSLMSTCAAGPRSQKFALQVSMRKTRLYSHSYKKDLTSIYEPVLQKRRSPVTMVCSKDSSAAKTMGRLDRDWQSMVWMQKVLRMSLWTQNLIATNRCRLPGSGIKGSIIPPSFFSHDPTPHISETDEERLHGVASRPNLQKQTNSRS